MMMQGLLLGLCAFAQPQSELEALEAAISWISSFPYGTQRGTV